MSESKKYIAKEIVPSVFAIRDSRPAVSWKEDVCTVYAKSSVLTPEQITGALNLYDELRSMVQGKPTLKTLMETIKNNIR